MIMPLLCQLFLSSNVEAHVHLARGGKQKDTLVILVPEHLVPDAKTQVYRHCLNLNFRQEYRVYDDIFTLLHPQVQLGSERGSHSQPRPMKQIFVTSFNQFKKALTYDKICQVRVWCMGLLSRLFFFSSYSIIIFFHDYYFQKIRPHREHILVITDEVDDFLGECVVHGFRGSSSNLFSSYSVIFFHDCFQTGTNLYSIYVQTRQTHLQDRQCSSFTRQVTQHTMVKNAHARNLNLRQTLRTG